MIKLARRLAKKAQHTFALHAAIVQRGGAIVSTGYNHDYIHAEINALKDMWPSKRKGCRVWSIRVTKGGKLANAKPCDSCETYMRHWGIKTVWYSNESGEIVRMDF